MKAKTKTVRICSWLLLDRRLCTLLSKRYLKWGLFVINIYKAIKQYSFDLSNDLISPRRKPNKYKSKNL